MPIGRPPITVQWHITTNCDNKCAHCYMFDSETFSDERDNTLSLKDMHRVLDSLDDFEKKWNADISQFAISGGDPLLREDWPFFIGELRKRGKTVSMMGNPETLTEANVKTLAELGVQAFQMSLDGLESTHDSFRAKGSFKNTVEKLELLRKYNIDAAVMFTLFPANANDFIPLLRFVAENSMASVFAFDLGCSVGNAKELSNNFRPEEIKELFERFIDEKKRLENKGCTVDIREKSHLLKLVHFDNNDYHPINTPDMPIVSGCPAGWHSVVILSDGTLLACRRLLNKIGKMPEQSFEEIYLGSSFMKKLRRADSFESCGSCDFYQTCRGCPAAAYGETGDPFAKNQFCFRESLSQKATDDVRKVLSPAETSSYEEEFALIASSFHARLPLKFPLLLKDKCFQTIFMDLAYSTEERKRFLLDPDNYLINLKVTVSEFAKVSLLHFFSELGDKALKKKGATARIANHIMSQQLNNIMDCP